jgi:hypothetical protein
VIQRGTSLLVLPRNVDAFAKSYTFVSEGKEDVLELSKSSECSFRHSQKNIVKCN